MKAAKFLLPASAILFVLWFFTNALINAGKSNSTEMVVVGVVPGNAPAKMDESADNSDKQLLDAYGYIDDSSLDDPTTKKFDRIDELLERINEKLDRLLEKRTLINEQASRIEELIKERLPAEK